MESMQGAIVFVEVDQALGDGGRAVHVLGKSYVEFSWSPSIVHGTL